MTKAAALLLKTPPDTERSPHWPKVRADHLFVNPACSGCGKKKNLEVHHIQPYHEHPELELDTENLTTLCETYEDGLNCHLLLGHLGNYKSVNKTVLKDALYWRKKITNRKIV